MAGSSDSDDLKKLFRQAAEIAAVVPESMHGVAFTRALDELTERAETAGTEPIERTPSRPALHTKAAKPSDDWMQQIDRTKYPQISGSRTVFERALGILKIARDDFNIDAMSPADISKISTQKFRQSMTAAQVSDKLGKANKEVNRTKQGSGFVYSLMQPGEEMLESSQGESSSRTRRRKTPRSKPRVSTKSHKETEPKAATAKRASKSKGRPGPKAMAEELIETGFFSQPRQVKDIIDYARRTMAYTYKATDLSPTLVRLTREHKLKRTTGKDGQYEYTTP